MTVSDKNTEKNSKGGKTPPLARPPGQPQEFGGPKGPEPTRYGDWEKKGRCIDFLTRTNLQIQRAQMTR